MTSSNRARRIGHNVLSLFGSDAVARLCTYFTIWFLNRHWEVSLYGQYAVVVNWLTILITFSDLGFNVLIIREVAHRRESVPFYLRNVMAMKLFFSSIFVLFLWGVGWVLHYEPLLRTAMFVISLRLFLEAVSAVYTYLLQAHEMMVYQSIVTMIASFLRMAGVILTVHFGGGVVAVCVVWLAESILTSSILVGIGLKKGWKPDLGMFRWKEGWSVLGAGIPLAAFGTFQMLYNRVDLVILKSLSGNEAVAYYDIASRLLWASVLPSSLFSVAVLPALSASQDNVVDFGKLTRRAIKALALMGFPVAVGGFFLSKSIIALFFKKELAPSAEIFSVMAFYIGFYYLMRIPVNILAIKKASQLIGLYSVMFLVNLTLNFLFIPRWGYMGGAYAISLCGLVEFGAGLWMVRDYSKELLKGDLVRELGLGLLSALIMGGFIWIDPRIYWLVLAPVVYLIALVLLRVLNEDDWNNICSVVRWKKA